MSSNEYLQKVLKSQTLESGSNELTALQDEREKVETLLRGVFPERTITIRYGGSKAKNTMVKASYDLDITCTFDSDDNQAGTSLEAIYWSVYGALKNDYHVDPKRSALRLKKQDDLITHDFHIDVVPERFVNGSAGDAFLFQNCPEKTRLKTNLQVHIDHVRDSGLTDVIKLTKLWRECWGLHDFKTFILELMVIEILADKKRDTFDSQLVSLWETMQDSIDNVKIEDPANPTGNDLSGFLTPLRPVLKQAAKDTLATVNNSGWEALYGSFIDAPPEKERHTIIYNLPKERPQGAKPWSY